MWSVRGAEDAEDSVRFRGNPPNKKLDISI